MLDVLSSLYRSIQSPDTDSRGNDPNTHGGNAISWGMKISSTCLPFEEPIPDADLFFQNSLDYLLDSDQNGNIRSLQARIHFACRLAGRSRLSTNDAKTIEQ
ncbi:MAG: hypothetical protein F6K19_47035 [Cyanothece sp. SIO1E1]|nr:hypothetical protein [Cyanothece sp. SIO1E1]